MQRRLPRCHRGHTTDVCAFFCVYLEFALVRLADAQRPHVPHLALDHVQARGRLPARVGGPQLGH